MKIERNLISGSQLLWKLHDFAAKEEGKRANKQKKTSEKDKDKLEKNLKPLIMNLRQHHQISNMLPMLNICWNCSDLYSMASSFFL